MWPKVTFWGVTDTKWHSPSLDYYIQFNSNIYSVQTVNRRTHLKTELAFTAYLILTITHHIGNIHISTSHTRYYGLRLLFKCHFWAKQISSGNFFTKQVNLPWQATKHPVFYCVDSGRWNIQHGTRSGFSWNGKWEHSKNFWRIDFTGEHIMYEV